MDIMSDDAINTTPQKTKRRRTREDWQALVSAWESSNQTQQAFCQDRGLCYRQFNQWKSRFKQESLAEQENNVAAQFVPIQLKPPAGPRPSMGVQVYLPNGIRIDVSSEHEVPVLLGSAKALMALSC